MRIIVLSSLVLSIILTGCVGVNGEPLVIPDGHEIRADGFIDGCMTSILALTSQQNLPPYSEALKTCQNIYQMAEDGFFGTMPSEMSAPVKSPAQTFECSGNCL